MVRAILKKGQIQPLDPLPTSWQDGQELAIATLDEDDMVDREAIEHWHQEHLALSAGLTDEDDRLLRTALEEQSHLAKEAMRHEWEQTT